MGTPDPEEEPKKGAEKGAEAATVSPVEQREAVKGKSARGRADISLESLESRTDRNYDAETPKLINEINFTESADAQEKKLRSLTQVSAMILSNIIARNPDIAKKIDLTKFENIPLLMEYFDSIRPEAAENAAMHKLQEMRDQMTADVSIAMKESWPEIVDFAQKSSRETKLLLEANFKKEHPEKSEDGYISKSVEFAKHHQILTAGIALAGAYGVYKLWNWMFPGKEEKKDEKAVAEGKEGEKKEPEKKGGFLKWIVGGAIAIGGIFGLGRFLGSDGVKKWIKDKLGWNVSDNRISQALTHLSHGEFKKAGEVLWKGADENSDFHEKMAAVISKEMGKEISAKTLFELKDEKFEDFISTASSFVDLAEEKTGVYVGDTGIIGTLAKTFLGSQKEIQEKRTLRTFLVKHENDIRAKMTVNLYTKIEDVLQKLSENPSAIAGSPATTETVAPKDVDVATAVETGVDKVAGVSKQTLSDLKEEFKDKPAFQEFLKKYDGKWYEAILSPFVFIGHFLTACKKDGIVTAIGGGSILIWNGYKFATFTSLELLANTAVELVKAPFSDEITASDAVIEYVEGAIPFMIIGAAYMGGRGWLARTGALKGALHGVGHGAIFPLEVPRLHVAAGQHLYRTAKGKLYDIKVWKGRAETVPQIRADQARFFAKVSASYDELVTAADTPGRNLTVKKWWGKYTRTRAIQLREDYLRRFVRAYNELQEALKVQGLPCETIILEKEIQDASAIKKMAKFLETHEEAKVGAIPSLTPTILDVEPEFVKMEGSGATSKHTYKFNKETFILTESEISTKATEIERANPGRDAAVNWKEAVRTLVEEKYLTPTPIAGKPNTYKFQSREFTFTPEEIRTRVAMGVSETDAVRSLCYEKVLAHVTVEDVKMVKGKYHYKIGGKWTEPLDNPVKVAEVRAKFLAELEKKGISLDFQRFAAESKALSYFPVLEKIIGTSAAVLLVYHLETATDKRKAIAETAAGFGSFWAGMKLTDWKIGSKIKPATPGKLIARTVIDIMGGLAAAYSFTEPIGQIVEHFYARIPGSYGVSGELIDIFEKATTRSTVRMLAASAERGLLKKLAVKTGMKGISEIFEKKIAGTFMKKIGQIAAKQGFKQVLKALGWKGITTAALLADDATIIGVVDDIVAAGLLVWMSFDIYDIVKLVANAKTVQNEMVKRSGVAITSFRILDPKSRAVMQEKLTPFGLTVERAHELGEQQLFDILRTIPETAVEIKRAGIAGKEVWYLKKAEAIGITITDNSGKEIAKISDEDAVKLDQVLSSMEKEKAS